MTCLADIDERLDMTLTLYSWLEVRCETDDSKGLGLFLNICIFLDIGKLLFDFETGLGDLY